MKIEPIEIGGTLHTKIRCEVGFDKNRKVPVLIIMAGNTSSGFFVCSSVSPKTVVDLDSPWKVNNKKRLAEFSSLVDSQLAGRAGVYWDILVGFANSHGLKIV